MDLKGKNIIVTGGAVRLGRSICEELIRAGGRVICQYNSSIEKAEALKAAFPEQVFLKKLDLTAKGAIAQLVNEALAVGGSIDVLINNAALFFKTELGSVKEDDWDTFFNLNLKSAFFLAQAVSREMLKQKRGKIINIGDSGAITPFPAYIPYSITKAGIMNMTHGLAKALAPHIQVNCVNPGPVMMPAGMPQKEKEFALEQTLLKREGSAEDVARTVRFLLEGSDYITGAIIPVDGGRQIR